jgi:hypothetical protein
MMSKQVYIVELVEKYRPFEEILGVFVSKELAVEFLLSRGYKPLNSPLPDQFSIPGNYQEIAQIHTRDLIDSKELFPN